MTASPRRLIPSSLFGRAVLTLFFTFGLFALVTFYVVVRFALTPVVERSASDLAGILVLSARTLAQLPPELDDAYRDKLLRDYEVGLLDSAPEEDSHGYFFPFLRQVEKALEARLGHPVMFVSSLREGRRWFWVALEAGGQTIWTGFPRDRVETRPLEGVFVILGAALLLMLGTAAILARRVTRPLNRLSEAAREVARGHSPNPLPETGPDELADLARQFNATSRQVRELLANRTLLLAGISHDLRTPLTRLRLALEMLPSDAAPDLVARMERDIDQMNALITQSIELGKSLGAGRPEEIDLSALIQDLVSTQPRVIWQRRTACRHAVDPLALRRILGNLLENALRYSRGRVEVHLDCGPPQPVIFVADRGPGIPEAEREAVFRPFYRLEHSRSRQTGGAGLGLAVARQLAVANHIELHLGERRGGGTVVSVRLPPARTGEREAPGGAAVDDLAEGP